MEMNGKQKLIEKGFIAAGLMNLSVLLFSMGFTNETINKYDPQVMSNFGLVMIVLWGLSYMAIAKNYEKLKWLVLVFAIEKLCYGIVWINWMSSNGISEVIKEDMLAGIFYAIYGINDWLFCIFFFLVFVQICRLSVEKR